MRWINWFHQVAITGALSAALGLAQAPPPAPPGSPAPPAPPAGRVQVFSMAGGGSYLGIGVRDVESERVKDLKLKEERGVEITTIEDDSPASRAGLQKADVVLEYNGQRVEGVEQFIRMVRETPAGREAKLTVSRDGRILNLAAKVAERKGFSISKDGGRMMPRMAMPEIVIPEMPRPLVAMSSGFLGIEAEGLSGGLADYFGVKSGVLVRSVNKGTPAEKAGLQPGDVIVKVDGQAVGATGEVTKAIRERLDKKTFPLTIIRNKGEMTINVTIEAERPRGFWTPGVRSVTARPGNYF